MNKVSSVNIAHPAIIIDCVAAWLKNEFRFLHGQAPSAEQSVYVDYIRMVHHGQL